MRRYSASNDSYAADLSAARSGRLYPADIVLDEPAWRILPDGYVMTASRVAATRWHGTEDGAQEFGAETPRDSHLVKIVLRSMNIRLSVGGRVVHDGITTPGMFHVSEPGARVRCLFRGSYDVLHLHVPIALIAECTRDLPRCQAAILPAVANPSKDAMIERLGRALLAANELGPSVGRLYADCIGVAIVARLASAPQAAVCDRPRVGELARWRLKRAVDYVEASLADPISLADIASATGLTRMHFAAQFKAATGLRPHEYLLRRRIERAQEMLIKTRLPLAEVALSVGFQTQSHFTAVFKRFVGRPPHAWRRSCDDGAVQRA